jgi:hypothetical protein
VPNANALTGFAKSRRAGGVALHYGALTWIMRR